MKQQFPRKVVGEAAASPRTSQPLNGLGVHDLGTFSADLRLGLVTVAVVRSRTIGSLDIKRHVNKAPSYEEDYVSACSPGTRREEHRVCV